MPGWERAVDEAGDVEFRHVLVCCPYMKGVRFSNSSRPSLWLLLNLVQGCLLHCDAVFVPQEVLPLQCISCQISVLKCLFYHVASL